MLSQIAEACEAGPREAYASRAVQLLEQLQARGWLLGPQAREQLQADPRIEILRRREDFRALCARVAGTAAQDAAAARR